MDIVIIGNGILAGSTALRLAKRAGNQDKITIIGKRARPGSATLAAAAMLNSFCEIEEGSLESDLAMYRFELSHLATRMWPDFVMEVIKYGGSKLPGGCAKCQGLCGGCFALGTYLINNTAADRLDDINFNAVVKALNDFDEPYQEVDPGSIPNYIPEERYRAVRAIYIPNEGWLNPRLTMDAVDSALSSFSCVNFVDEEVESIVKQGSLIDHVRLIDGTKITGDKFMLATGATSTDLLAKSNLELNIQRIFYGIGVSLEIKSPEYPHTKCIRTPNRGLACGLYSVPYFISHDVPHDSIIIGASNFIAPYPMNSGRMVSVANLMKGAMDQINKNFFRATISRINVGWRPTSADTYPLLGGTSISNFFVATGTKRDGFHLCPVISEIMCSLIHGEAVDPRFDCFKPERAPIRDMTREEAIETAVKHQMSAAYQHGYNPSHSRMNEQMMQMYRDDLERLHDQVGAKDWGIPPEMIEMYRYGHIKWD
jgi:glycine oxidase